MGIVLSDPPWRPGILGTKPSYLAIYARFAPGSLNPVRGVWVRDHANLGPLLYMKWSSYGMFHWEIEEATSSTPRRVFRSIIHCRHPSVVVLNRRNTPPLCAFGIRDRKFQPWGCSKLGARPYFLCTCAEVDLVVWHVTRIAILSRWPSTPGHFPPLFNKEAVCFAVDWQARYNVTCCREV